MKVKRKYMQTIWWVVFFLSDIAAAVAAVVITIAMEFIIIFQVFLVRIRIFESYMQKCFNFIIGVSKQLFGIIRIVRCGFSI